MTALFCLEVERESPGEVLIGQQHFVSWTHHCEVRHRPCPESTHARSAARPDRHWFPFWSLVGVSSRVQLEIVFSVHCLCRCCYDCCAALAPVDLSLFCGLESATHLLHHQSAVWAQRCGPPLLDRLLECLDSELLALVLRFLLWRRRSV